MNIWIIKTGEQTEHDPNSRLLRSGQIFQTLKKKGVNITWFNSSFNHQLKKQRFKRTTILRNGRSKIVYLYGNSYENNISFKRFKSQIVNAIEFIKYLTKNKYENPDLIISSYPTVELSFLSCLYAKKNNIPFLIDVRDMWPDIILKNLTLYKKFFFYPIFFVWNKCFKYCLKNASSIVSISHSFLNWSLNKGNISKSKFHKYFLFTKQIETKKFFNLKEKKFKFLKEKKRFIKVIYCGSISKRHDFETFFHALKFTNNKKIITLVCGKGLYFDELKYKYRQNKNLFFLGWMNNKNLNYLLSICDYGLLPYHSMDFEMSYPNKLSEYLSNNLKILSCIGGISKKLIKNKNLGHIYKYKSEKALLRILNQLKKNQDKKSINTYNKIFSYDKIMNNFLIHIEKVKNKKLL